MTTTINTIGVGKDYGDPYSWATATKDPTGGNIYIGELTDDLYAIPIFTPALALDGTTNNASNYRILRAESGNEFVPHTYAGARIEKQAPTSVLTVSEDFTEVHSVGLIQVANEDDDITSGSTWALKIEGVSNYVSRSYFEMQTGVGTSHVYGLLIDGAENPRVENCVSKGTGIDRGMSIGIYFAPTGSAASTHVDNCTVHDVRRSGSLQGRGLYMVTQFDGSVTNILATNCLNFDAFDFATQSNLSNVHGGCTSDDSGSNFSPSGTAQPRWNVSTNSIYANAASGDLRLRYSSGASDIGTDHSARFTTDIVGTTRDAPWEVGAYTGFFIPTGVAPTVVEETIGTGGDYATIALWLAATEKNFVDENKVYRGLLLDEEHALASVTQTVQRGISDSTRYRELTAAPGAEFDPKNASKGARISSTATSGIVRVHEHFFRMNRIGISADSATPGADHHGIIVNANDVWIDAVSIVGLAGTPLTDKAAIYLRNGSRSWVTNCVVRSGNTDGFNVGILVESADARIWNNVVHKIKVTAGATGYKSAETSALFENNVSFNTDVDFDTAANTQSHNASSDSTADGAGSITGITGGVEFVDVSSFDYRLTTSSQLINAGRNLSDQGFSTDAVGSTRGGVWEMGVFDGYLLPPEYPATQANSTFRHATCWEIERVDGVSLRFTDHDRPIPFRGQTYTPASGFDASARRYEMSLRESSVEVVGMLSASGITESDILRGLYRDARVTAYLIDWRFPFAAPKRTDAYRVGPLTHDSEGFRVTILGLADRLNEKVGPTWGPLCEYDLGSPVEGLGKCFVDLTPLRKLAVDVTEVVDDRLQFKLDPADITIGNGDGFYDDGKLTWRTGANAGVVSEIQAYTETSSPNERVFSLHLKTPFPIEVGDTCDFYPGCDKRASTCQSKFANFVNFGGEPFIPGTDKLLQTPQQ